MMTTPQTKGPIPSAIEIKDIPIDTIEIEGRNRRGNLKDEPATSALAKSIDKTGLLHPIVVMALGAAPDGIAKQGYLLVGGERRLVAHQILQRTTIKASIMPYDPTWLLEARLSENMERQDLSPLERAIAVSDFIRHFEEKVADEMVPKDQDGGWVDGGKMRAAAIRMTAQRIGKTEAFVRDLAFIADLPAKVAEYVHQGKLPFEHAREIAKVADPDAALEICEKVRAGRKYHARDDADHPADSIDVVKSLVAKVTNSLKNAPWRLDVEFAGKPSCDSCQQNAKNCAGLFVDNMMSVTVGYSGTKEVEVPECGVCMNHACFRQKTQAYQSGVTQAARAVLREFSTVTVNGKKVEPAKDVPAQVKKNATLKHTPPFVPEKAMTAAVKDELAKQADKAARASGQTKVAKAAAKAEPSAKERAKKQLEEAYYKWRKATLDWSKLFVKDFDSALDKYPVLDLKIQLLNNIFIGGDLNLLGHVYRQEVPAIELTEAHKELIKHACTPALIGVEELMVALRQTEPNWYISCDRGVSLEGCTRSIAAPLVFSMLGIPVNAPYPSWSDFAPKPVAEEPAANTPAKKPAKKQAKKGGKK